MAIIIVFLSIIYSTDNNLIIINNILPSELSKNSIGINILSSNNKNSSTYFDYQTWITDNLLIDSYLSPSFNNSINISYGFDLGYCSVVKNKYLHSMIYTVGYHRKKFSLNESRVSDFSIQSMMKINNKNWFSISCIYLFNNKGNSKENNFFAFNYMRLFKDNFIINSGIQLHNDDNESLINYYVGLNYSL